jgi:hypothetical protein
MEFTNFEATDKNLSSLSSTKMSHLTLDNWRNREERWTTLYSHRLDNTSTHIDQQNGDTECH